MVKARFKVWFEKDQKIVFGKGRALLLEKIQNLGSLRKASGELNMSYRAAWGKLKATEEQLGIKLVETSPRGTKLTREGRQWLKKYKVAVDKVKEVI